MVEKYRLRPCFVD